MSETAFNIVLVTDCGSTTTKALLFERTSAGWRCTYRGEAPTTVEAPIADVTIGALNAFRELEELSGRKILKNGELSGESSPFVFSNGADEDNGIDIYLSTSSAGGGLQMIVTGLVKYMTTESAERAALGAGAIVMDSLSVDDGREDHEKIERIRHLRPDIVLLTGGIDGGATSGVVETAEVLAAAAPRPRFGDTLSLPIIYAGNKEAAKEVKNILSKIGTVSVVENVRPSLEEENIAPAREEIHEYFLSHVMSHSPGYSKLLGWAGKPVMPTPAAVGEMIQVVASKRNLNVLAVDIGGATTDVFSVFRDAEGKSVFNRTVSANLGMSYSVANVLIEAGVANIKRWLPFELSDKEIIDRLRNKMIRPTTIPQTLEDLWLEQAVCREALRLSLEHHRSLAVGLSGVQKQRGISDIFSQTSARQELVDMMALDLVVGSGGVLSHAPMRLESALMVLDGFELQGLTQIAVDSIFMLPHLGVFASVDEEAATEILFKDCLINVAFSVVPVCSKKLKRGQDLVRVSFNGESLGTIEAESISVVKPALGRGTLRVEPASNAVNVGAGFGVVIEKEIEIGLAGIILDGRNRPIEHPLQGSQAALAQKNYYEKLELFR